MIKNNGNALKQRIVDVLKLASFKTPPDENGKQTDVFLINDSGNIVNFNNPAKPKYEEKYSSNKETGLEKIAEAIAKEVLNFIVENADVNLKERLNKLESDYNNLLIAINASAAGLSITPLTPVGTALTSIAIAGGGINREVTTTQLMKLQNESTDIG